MTIETQENQTHQNLQSSLDQEKELLLHVHILKNAVVKNLLFTHLLNTIGLIVTLWFWSNQVALVIWGFAHMVIIALRSWHQSFARHVDENVTAIRRWLFAQAFGAFLASSCWVIVLFYLYPENNAIGQMVVIVWMAGLAVGASSTLAANLWASYAYIIPLMGALVVKFMLYDDASFWGFSIGAMALLGLLLSSALKNHQRLRDTFNLSLENERLIASLRKEKKQAQQQKLFAEENADFLNSIIENIDEGLCVFDKHNRLIIHNYYFYRLIRSVNSKLHRGMRLEEFFEILKLTDFGQKDGFRRVLEERMEHINRKLREPILWGDFVNDHNHYVEIVEHAMPTGEKLFTFRDVTDRYKGGMVSMRHSEIDPLTNTLNHHAFVSSMRDVLSLSDRVGHRVVLVIIDLVSLGRINELHGHLAGDAVLMSVAKRLKRNIRKTDVMGRLSGDQFALVLNGVADQDRVEDLGNRLMTDLVLPIKLEKLGLAVKVDVKTAVGEYRVHGESSELLISNALVGLSRIKHNPKLSLCVSSVI